MNSLAQLIKPDCRLPVALTLRSQAMTRKNHKLRLPPAFSIPRVISHRDQTLMRRYASLLVCLLSCLGLIPASIIGYFDDRPFIFIICLTGNLITLLGTIWIFFNRSYLVPMYLVLGGLITLGLYMTAIGGMVGNGSVVWLMILPSLSIVAMGRKHGSIVFFFAYFAVLLMFLPPLANYTPYKYNPAGRIWVLLVMFFCWIFAWIAEYARYKTQEQLIDVVTHLEHYAFTDTLTRIGNRREFENTFIRENALLLRKNKPFAIVMFDIDHFKAINDRYGHNAGDAVLVHTANLLRNSLRGSDQVCRWGGEEFTALLPDIALGEAAEIAERIRETVESTPCIYENYPIYYTISAGVHLCVEDLPLEKHIQQVDSLLYQAKKNGRNQIRFNDGPEYAVPIPANGPGL